MVFGHKDESIQVAIEVEGKDNPFFPGDKVAVTVTLTTKQGGEVKAMHAGLCLCSKRETATTKGEGDKEETTRKWLEKVEWIAEAQLIGEAELARGLNDTYYAQWTIPAEAAPSYKGDIIQHSYSVEVKLERKDGKDTNEKVEIVVAEPAPGKEARPGTYGEMKNSHDARMQFELTNLEFVEGEMLSGRVLVEPKVDIEAREVSLELWRVERVGEGDSANVSKHKAETHKLAGITILKSGEPATYDFSLPVKVEGCPTFKHDEAAGSWLLKAVISRPLATDCEVEQPISLYCAYRQG